MYYYGNNGYYGGNYGYQNPCCNVGYAGYTSGYGAGAAIWCCLSYLSLSSVQVGHGITIIIRRSNPSFCLTKFDILRK